MVTNKKATTEKKLTIKKRKHWEKITYEKATTETRLYQVNRPYVNNFLETIHFFRNFLMIGTNFLAIFLI